jgi:ribonuclease Z
MELRFLGTSSATPTPNRGLAGLAVRRGPQWDLFDCGEGTQERVHDVGLTLPRLRRVYISHLHGDHCFGLFGLLTSRGMTGGTGALDLYGPEGIEEMVSTVLTLSRSNLEYPLTFHTVPEQGGAMAHDDEVTVQAIPVSHGVPSFAWLVREQDRPGLFDVEQAMALGIPEGPQFGALEAGSAIELEDGRVIEPSQVVGPPRPGRSLVIAGDNRDPADLLARTGPVQLLVHEATFTERVVARLGDDRGHSTAARVATAAQEAGVDNLILTHFSARFESAGDRSLEEVRAEAEAAYEGHLVLAEDEAAYELTVDGRLTPRH